MNRLKNHICYLAGPIDRCPNKGVEWRREISEYLSTIGIGFFDPTDKPFFNSAYSEDKDMLEEINELKVKGEFDTVSSIVKNIVRADLSLVDRSDFIIAYIDTDLHMCGTYCEISYGALERKPVLIFCKQGKKGIPNWLFGLIPHELFFNNIDELQRYIEHVAFSPNFKNDHNGRWKFINYDKVYGVKLEPSH